MKNYLIQFKKSISKSKIFFLSFIFLASIFWTSEAQATAPVISEVNSSDITTVSATITWTTDIVSNSFVDYGTTTNYDQTRGNLSDSVTAHSVSIDGLSPNTPYRFRVRSTNGGNETINDNGELGFPFVSATAPTISNVQLAEVTNNYATITWDTDIEAYPYLDYGSTGAYGQLLGDDENSGTSHSMTLAGFSPGTIKHYRPRSKDLYGNFTYYGTDSTFTIGAPYLDSFTSSTLSATYGPTDEINITANYVDSASNNLGAASTITVLLDTGAQVVLGTVGTNTLSGTYTVGATGFGENSNDLSVASIVSQNVCDTNNYCHTGLTMPSSNISTLKDIQVDTIAPVFSAVVPANSAYINSVITSSDISYTLSETLDNAAIVIAWASGSEDLGSPHTCTLIGAALAGVAHNNFDTTNCSGGAITLVNGAVYSFDFNGEDLVGNMAAQVSRTGVTFDTSAPVLASFTSTTADETYGPTNEINITATYGVGEELANGSSITVTLDTSAQVVLDTVGTNTLSGTYTVGATGSGQNTSALTVSTINSQNAVDLAGNAQIGTGLPLINIDDGSTIIVDTVAPDAPSLVQFMSDPVNSSNEENVILRVSGEVGATILYSIDDANGSTDPVIGSSDVIEPDGSTDITGIDVSGLADDTLTATVTLRDGAQNESTSNNDTVVKDATSPTFLMQYYSDFDLADPLGDNSRLKAGTYYLKITTNETVVSAPTISIEAEGTNNDVSSAATSAVIDNHYRYTRTIIYDAGAIGENKENISLTATDNFGNTSTNFNAENEAIKAPFTDTVKPLISLGTVTPDYAKAGTANVSVSFNESMDQAVAPTVIITKSDLNNISVSGSYTGPTTWAGTASIASGDANGTATLKVSLAEDSANNVMDANNNVDTFFIDTVNPAFAVNDGTSPTSVTSDTIRVTVSDSGGSGVASQFFGFSANAVCDVGDTIDTIFNSGEDFYITGDHSDYLCVKATDNANNIAYETVGQLHVDNSAPTISSISSNHANGSFKAGAIIDIDLTFSEAITTTGDITVTLETGTTDRFCIITGIINSTTGSCDYTVQAGDTSSLLDVKTVEGTIKDQALNPMTDSVPTSNLAENKIIVIDTTAPTVDITAPLSGTKVKDDAVITFDDNEITDEECSIDNLNWVDCESGITQMSSLTGWGSLGDGNFTLYLRDTDLAGNIGTNNEANVIKDTGAPTISSISSNHDNGNFKADEIIDIDLTFSEAVTTTGDITVTLETGTTDRFCIINNIINSTTGSCNYTVQAGDTSALLDVKTVEGTIKDQALNPMTDLVPASNLAENKIIVIDTTAPTVSDVNSNHDDGIFSDPESIDIDVTFSEIVNSTGLVTVTLDSGGSCTFPISNSNFGSCNYIVQSGDNSVDLNIFSISGTIKDQALNGMTNYTPAVDHNLADNKAIAIDTTPEGKPTIVSISSEHDDGNFKVGEAIDIDVIFSEAVTSTGLVTITLDSGGSCTFPISNSTTGGCIYNVQTGENSDDLDVQLVSGVIKDQAQNLMTERDPASNLADTKAIVIDTTAPNAPVITLLDPITDANKTAVTITGTGEANAEIEYSIDDTNSVTNPTTGTGSVSGGGVIDITGIDLGQLDGGTITATMTLTDAAGNESTAGTDTATSQITKPEISDITSDHDDGVFTADERININLTFSEAVTTTGDITVTLETGTTDQFCIINNIINSTAGTCEYVVQAGDNSTDLDVKSVAGTIKDQALNLMTNFVPTTNLAENKIIVIDTTAPNAPVITLLDPITNANKTAVTITGTGEANANIEYSIDDTNSVTNPITGTGSVSGGGVIDITGIDLASLDGGTITVTMTLTDIALNESAAGTDTATSQIVRPTILSISSNHANGSFKAGAIIDIDLTFSEAITTTGDITVTLETGTTDRFCIINNVINSTTGSCNYTVQAGDTSALLDVKSVEGTIENQTGNSMINFVPADNLAENKTIAIDTTMVTLSSFTSSTISNVYGPTSAINITANYSEDLAVGSTVTVVSNTGAEIILATITDSTKLVGTYTVGITGSGENTVDLSVSAIASQAVCDLANNCETGTTLPLVNISSVSDIAIDTTAPDFFDILPAPSTNIDSVTDDSDISFSLTEDMASGTIIITRTAWAEDPDSPHICILEGVVLTAGEHLNFDTTYCQGGEITLVSGAVYTFGFQGEDLYDNTSEEEEITGVSFGMDYDAPIISEVEISSSTSSSAVVTWTTSENSSSLVDFGVDTDYGTTMGNSDDSTTEHSVTLTGLTPGADYLLRVRSTDVEDNEATDDDSGTGYDFSTLFLSVISNVVVSDITSSGAKITWNSDSSDYSYVYYGTTEEYGRIIGNEESLTQDHSITMAGLLPSTTYYFRARTKDISGNFSLGEEGEFTTLDGLDDETGETDPPTISSIKSSAGLNSARIISWKTNKVCNGMVRYGLETTYGQSAAEDATIYAVAEFATTHEITIDNLLSNTTYHYKVISYDSSGNIAISSDETFKTEALSSISAVSVTEINLNSATIIWETGDPTTSEVEYGLTTTYGKNKIDKTKTNMHKVQLVGLEAGKTYHFRVKGVNKDSNSVFSDDYIFATNASPKIDKREIKEITDSKIVLGWTTNVETDSQVEYLNKNNLEDKGVQGLIDLAINHEVTVNGLTQGSEYEIKIKGTDVNKVSFESEPFSVTTEMDRQAPQISQVNSQASLISGREDKVQAIILWKTDEVATSQVVFDTKKNSSDDASLQKSKEDANLSTNHMIVLTSLKPGAVYFFRVISKDKNTNYAQSEDFSLLTPRKQKSVIQLIIANFEETFGWMKKMKL